MEMISRFAAIAVLSSATVLLIKRSNPEISFLVSAATVTLLYIASFTLLREAAASLKATASVLGSSSVLIYPVLKCTGIAAISRFGSDLCRDASQSALAEAVETAGTLSAAAVAFPVVVSMMKIVGGML